MTYTWLDDTDMTALLLNTQIDDRLTALETGGSGSADSPTIKLHIGASKSAFAGTTFTTVVFDQDPDWDPYDIASLNAGSGYSGFDAPKTGWYWVTANLNGNFNSGRLGIQLNIVDSGVSTAPAGRSMTVVQTSPTEGTYTRLVHVTAGQRVECQVYYQPGAETMTYGSGAGADFSMDYAGDG